MSDATLSIVCAECRHCQIWPEKCNATLEELIADCPWIQGPGITPEQTRKWAEAKIAKGNPNATD